mgnify:CR=1 FL=1
MGNASRVFAVTQSLIRLHPDIEIHFFSWGRGADFLRKVMDCYGSSNCHLHVLRPYVWISPSSLPGLRILKIILNYLNTYLTNIKILREARRNIEPEAILLDSDYHFPAFWGLDRKIYFLGQAIDVVERARQVNYKPSWISRLSFWFCEVLDGSIQRFVSDAVFVPSFLENLSPNDSARVIRVPLIVREEFLRIRKGEMPSTKVLTMTSGSEIEREKMADIGKSLGAEKIGSPESREITMPEHFSEARLVVTQGGLSSISECIAMGKRMIVVPIFGRAEQEVNALTIQGLGMGEVWAEAKDFRVVSEPSRLMKPMPKILVHGAEVVAQFILNESLWSKRFAAEGS